MQRVALGFKLHTGWATLVAVAGHPGEIQVLLRRRIELLPPDDSIPRFVYHAASEMALPQATELIKRATRASTDAARLALKDALQEIAPHGGTTDVCGILAGSRSVQDDLAAVLRSHPLIHTAEGVLYRGAAVSACESRGLRAVLASEREVWSRAAGAWNIAETELRRNVDALRKTVGPPWSADHKTCTAIALLALKSGEASVAKG